ncbi:MAG: CinA family protein [Candidatus Rokubacteria bacterium]|nr:CinA family protein [Candidatus Rokubacteria bacterium]
MTELTALAASLGARLKERKETVAVAESSAGGLISAALLAVPGASAYFLGGAVIYTQAARRALLQVPDESVKGIRSSTEAYALVKARTIRTLLGTTWGLSETGASGPTGNRYGDAAGHACIAVVGPARRTCATSRARRSNCSAARSAPHAADQPASAASVRHARGCPSLQALDEIREIALELVERRAVPGAELLETADLRIHLTVRLTEPRLQRLILPRRRGDVGGLREPYGLLRLVGDLARRRSKGGAQLLQVVADRLDHVDERRRRRRRVFRGRRAPDGGHDEHDVRPHPAHRPQLRVRVDERRLRLARKLARPRTRNLVEASDQLRHRALALVRADPHAVVLLTRSCGSAAPTGLAASPCPAECRGSSGCRAPSPDPRTPAPARGRRRPPRCARNCRSR